MGKVTFLVILLSHLSYADEMAMHPKHAHETSLSENHVNDVLILSYPGQLISAERPGNANGTQTVGKYRTQIETGLQISDKNQTTFSLPTLVRMGLHSRVELRLGTGVFNYSDDTLQVADVSLGAKIQVANGGGFVPAFAVSTDVTFPKGHFDNQPTYDGRFLASWELPANLSLTANLGLFSPYDIQERYFQVLYIGNLSWTFPTLLYRNKFSVFAEYFGTQLNNGIDNQTTTISAGLAYIFCINTQFDAFIQHGLDNEAPDLNLSFGVSHRF